MAEAEDVVFQYLQSKLLSILQEEEANRNIPSSIIPRFKSIKDLINSSKCRTSPFPVDHLYDLINELSECRFRNAAVSRTGPFRIKPLSNCFFASNYDVERRLEDIKKKLENISTVDPTPTRSVPIQQTSPAIDTSGIIGFKSQMETIENLLLRDTSVNEESEGSITSIGIVGMSGCGKTALAQKVFGSPRIQGNFSPRIWVSMSGMLLDKEKPVDTRVRVLNHILDEIGHCILDSDHADIGVAKLLEKLQRALMGKRYLIVLDDMWREDEWFRNLDRCLPRGHATTGASFSHGLPGGSGGAVIVTSRLEDAVGRMVGEKHAIRMEANMNRDECCEIFSHVAQEMDESWMESKLWTEMREYIIRKCDGLPLAVRTLANVISPSVESFRARLEAEAEARIPPPIRRLPD